MPGFTADINEAMQYALTYKPTEPYTTFPIEDLKEVYSSEKYKREPIRLVVISDNDPPKELLTGKLNGETGKDLLRQIRNERGGGDFLLGLQKGEKEETSAATRKELNALGFEVHLLTDWTKIVKAAERSAEAIYDPYRHLQKLQQRDYNR